ncbi:HDOD domain-containing protein [Vibrio sp. JC009]|uniref:EAL and HDOD domain-containing protein n=1 Tax=Vibrio sp. JC009 TaxID=2912314 RepID=UPI0023B1B68A|nr:HDOD domain-containing protein [Vibrio sp. JC009]WED23758.1 HDOD domain-containing protein [Vibrio sp. JC009]
MKYSYVARQPILDKDKKTTAYELLFRDGPKNAFPLVDPEYATSKLLSDQFLTHQYHSIDDKVGFVNFTYESILSQFPTLFPESKMVVEILEGCKPTTELLKEFKNLKSLGYKIALDDFIPSPEWRPFFPYVDIIKIDLRQVPVNKAASFISKLKETEIEFLAEKVETYEEFQSAHKAGFDYFQGYFFSQPEIIEKKALDSSFFTIIELCKCIAQDEIDFTRVEQLISVDVTLSFKLLRYVNSNAYIKKPIDSFKQALAYLGEDNLRKFISLAALAAVKESKPDSLYNLSVQRAKFCELIAVSLKGKEANGQGFLCGMFSLLDSLLDMNMESIIASLPVDEEIKTAILSREGTLGDILVLAESLEKAHWKQVMLLEEKLELSDETISDAYQRSIRWTDEIF